MGSASLVLFARLSVSGLVIATLDSSSSADGDGLHYCKWRSDSDTQMVAWFKKDEESSSPMAARSGIGLCCVWDMDKVPLLIWSFLKLLQCLNIQSGWIRI
ncbi:hypothetical protein F2Q68_00005618 [Brassica cretica]|uniref:Secreted protein n=1 Tax=Brassica cretica TaxID=69181 RepID=A0A8S9J8T0_BRACR|nr:hypothetical protein F2Q68_00005618 [Brassica cretica]